MKGLRVAFVVVAIMIAGALSACDTAPPKVEVTPKVAPPAVAQEGVLLVGVDLEQPPFAGVEESRTAGIDVDVASALAGSLGLTVKFVDVKPSDAATALASGKVDVVMSVPYDDAALTELTLSGAYLNTAPALFVATDSTASVEPSLTLDSLTADKVGAQTESMAFWILRQQIDPEIVAEYPSLRDALTAAESGEVQLAAGDAATAAYILRDIPTVHFAGVLAKPTTLGVAVRLDNAELSDKLAAALDEMAAGGVLETIRGKWLGDLPSLDDSATAGATETTPTP